MIINSENIDLHQPDINQKFLSIVILITLVEEMD